MAEYILSNLSEIRFLYNHIDHKISTINIDHKIKYTFETSNTAELNALPYLDVRVIIQNGAVNTDLYSKPTDTPAVENC